MDGLSEVLERLVVDPDFRARLLADPMGALSGFELSDEHRQALASPGPHWMALAAEVLRGGEVPAGASWDPSDDSVPPSVTTEAQPTAWPPANVLLSFTPTRDEQGYQAWSVELLPDSPTHREQCAHTIGVAVSLTATAAGVDAHAQPLQPVSTAEPPAAAAAQGPRWGHLDTPFLRGEAAAALAAEDRLLALERYVAVVGGRAELTHTDTPAPPISTGHITVVGLGITGVDHITHEADQAIRDARQVLYVEARVGLRRYLQARCDTVTALFDESYSGWSGRLSTYDHIAARVLDAALDGGSIVLAVQGHPTVFSYVPVLLRDAAPALGLTVRVQPGISAEDCLMAELAIDPADHGIQAFEATDLLLRRRPIQPDVATLIWQVGNLETRLHSARPSQPERLHRLVAWLRRTFPADHPVAMVHIPTLPGLTTTVQHSRLEDLPEHASALHAAVTLYLPPVGRRLISDPALAKLVDDPAHLAAITEPRS